MITIYLLLKVKQLLQLIDNIFKNEVQVVMINLIAVYMNFFYVAIIIIILLNCLMVHKMQSMYLSSG